MADNNSLKKAYQDGLQGRAYLGILADDEEMATNRRALEDRARIEEEDRRARERDEAWQAQEDEREQGREEREGNRGGCLNDNRSGLGYGHKESALENDSMVEAYGLLVGPLSNRPSLPVEQKSEADRLLASLKTKNTRPQFRDPKWKKFYDWYYNMGYQCALRAEAFSKLDVNKLPVNLQAWKIAEMAAVDGYGDAALQAIRRAGLSKEDAFAEIVRSSAPLTASELYRRWAAECFTESFERGLAGSCWRKPGLVMDQSIGRRPSITGYMYGCAKRLDPSLP